MHAMTQQQLPFYTKCTSAIKIWRIVYCMRTSCAQHDSTAQCKTPNCFDKLYTTRNLYHFRTPSHGTIRAVPMYPRRRRHNTQRANDEISAPRFQLQSPLVHSFHWSIPPATPPRAHNVTFHISISSHSFRISASSPRHITDTPISAAPPPPACVTVIQPLSSRALRLLPPALPPPRPHLWSYSTNPDPVTVATSPRQTSPPCPPANFPLHSVSITLLPHLATHTQLHHIFVQSLLLVPPAPHPLSSPPSTANPSITVLIPLYSSPSSQHSPWCDSNIQTSPRVLHVIGYLHYHSRLTTCPPILTVLFQLF